MSWQVIELVIHRREHIREPSQFSNQLLFRVQQNGIACREFLRRRGGEDVHTERYHQARDQGCGIVL